MYIHHIRKFNRYYTRILGVFDKTVFDLDYSMIEMRIIGEIARHDGITAILLTKYLNIKKSYLSHILNKLERAGYIFREKNTADSRIYHLHLTKTGVELNKHIEEQSDKKVYELISSLSNEEIQKLVDSMSTIEKILYKVISNDLEEK